VSARARRQRLRLVRATAGVLVPLAAVGWLLAAPHDLAAARLGSVSLSWWAAGLAGLVALLALSTGPRTPRRPA
jgi:hypothetical protein